LYLYCSCLTFRKDAGIAAKTIDGSVTHDEDRRFHPRTEPPGMGIVGRRLTLDSVRSPRSVPAEKMRKKEGARAVATRPGPMAETRTERVPT
jgi:hypothetical protein